MAITIFLGTRFLEGKLSITGYRHNLDFDLLIQIFQIND
jgi:hypothetical protein